MKRTIMIIGIIAVSMFTGIQAEAQGGASSPSAAGQSSLQNEAAQVEMHFNQAHTHMQNREAAAAADEIRKAADAIKSAETGESRKGRRAATHEVNRLEKLANDVQRGRATDQQMRDTFAVVHHELAKEHHAEADRLWKDKKAQEAGTELQAAIANLEDAEKWSGEQTTSTTSRVWHDTRETAGLLVRGVGYVPEEVGKGIKFVGDEIDKLGKKMQGKKK